MSTVRIQITYRPGGITPGHALHGSPQAGAPTPWGGARQLLTQLAAQQNLDEWEATPAALRPMLAIAFSEWRGRLTAAEQEWNDGFACSCPAALTYPSFPVGPLEKAFVETLAGLIPEASALLVFSEILQVDTESAGLVLPLLRKAGQKLSMQIGCDLEAVAANPAAQFARERTLGILGTLRALDGVEVETIAEPNPEPAVPMQSDASKLWDDAETADFGTLVALARSSFAAFGMEFAYTLAVRLLERDPDAAEANELHAIAGL